MHVLYTLATMIHVQWLGTAVILVIWRHRSDEPLFQAARVVWAELRPFYLPTLVFRYAYVFGDPFWPLPVHLLLLAMDIWLWFLYRNAGNDDRWKRRRAKLTEVVTRAGSRLRTAPSMGGA